MSDGPGAHTQAGAGAVGHADHIGALLFEHERTGQHPRGVKALGRAGFHVDNELAAFQLASKLRGRLRRQGLLLPGWGLDDDHTRLFALRGQGQRVERQAHGADVRRRRATAAADDGRTG
ncbi:MAG: hypothetical protein C4309_03695, partial [Chloroflexota bacterium]